MLADLLGKLSRVDGRRTRPDRRSATRLDTVADGARCFLATQQQVVVGSLLERFGDVVDGHVDRVASPGSSRSWSPSCVDHRRRHRPSSTSATAHKQPDWTYGDGYTGQSPADRLDEHRSPKSLDG